MRSSRLLSYFLLSGISGSFLLYSCNDDEPSITFSPDEFVIEVFSTDCFTNFNTSTCPDSNVTIILVSGKVEGPVGSSFGVFVDAPVEMFELGSTWTMEGQYFTRAQTDAVSGQFDYIAQLSCIPADSLYGPVDITIRIFAPDEPVTSTGGIKILETQAICD